jgi:spoIIIJ-associated protein
VQARRVKSIEQTGRTVEDAVTAALGALGVERDQVDVEVLTEESRGLLGILGHTQAKVRVTVKQSAEESEEHPADEVEEEPAEDLEEEPAEDLEEEPAEDLEGESAEQAEERPLIQQEDASDLAQQACGLLGEVLGLMGIDGTPEITRDDSEGIHINIRTNADLGLLIGRRGQTLAALQLIVAMLSNRRVDPELRKKVVLDVEGYRLRRERSLRAMARSSASRAKSSGRPVTLSSLNARERRIIHLALADDPSVTTRSEGEDPDRSIVITPRGRS